MFLSNNPQLNKNGELHHLLSMDGLPVEFIDERLTSAAAESSLSEAGVASRKRKPLVDQVAAQHILQAYLDSAARSR